MHAVTLQSNPITLKTIIDFAKELAAKQNTDIIITESEKMLSTRAQKKSEFFNFAGTFKGEFTDENANTLRKKKFL